MFAGSGRSLLEWPGVVDRLVCRSRGSLLLECKRSSVCPGISEVQAAGTGQPSQARMTLRPGALRPFCSTDFSALSGTEPDDQQRQGKADTDGAPDDRRKRCEQIFSVTQL